MDKGEYLKLFANCIVVKGAKRSTVCDLQKNKYELIPNSLADVIIELKNKPVKKVLHAYSEEDQNTINEYVKFLLENEFAFYCDEDELSLFPEIITQWDYPGEISNAIIDIDIESKHNYQDLFFQLEGLGCKYILIRSFSKKEISFWGELLSLVQNSRISSFEIITPYYEAIENKILSTFLSINKRVRSITFTNSKDEGHEIIENCFIEYTKRKVNSSHCCGSISPNNFMVNSNAFFESKNHNSCLNRKLSIDVNGFIKNCPAMEAVYGKADRTLLNKAIEIKEFKSVWEITKEQINTCKDCEFRHVCSDCRAFLRKDELYNKPKKCNYDPFSATWKR